MNPAEQNDATLMIRLPSELKADLMRAAAINGRRITTEINMRLKESLQPKTQAQGQTTRTTPLVSYSTERTTTPAIATDVEPAGYGVTDIERAMLAIFRAMPAEKQLSLLTLFR